MLFIAADHAGFKMKEFIAHKLASQGVSFEDFGTFSEEMDDYTVHAHRVAKAVKKAKGVGILICGTGVGMSMAANRHSGIRAAVVWNGDVARRVREEDDANIVCLPSRVITNNEAWEALSVFMATSFSHIERYKRRLTQIEHEAK